MRELIGLLAGESAPVVAAPKWLKGMDIRPVLMHGHLWWECIPFLIVRGGPPSGVAFMDSEPRRMPKDFGPGGRAAQVIPAEKDVNGLLALRDQVGDLRGRCMWQHFKLANQMIENVWWFAYAPPDPDADDKPPLTGMVWERDHFVPVAFVSQVAVALHSFLTQEQIDALPTFRGVHPKERGDE